jgi:hypothetical protein
MMDCDNSMEQQDVPDRTNAPLTGTFSISSQPSDALFGYTFPDDPPALPHHQPYASGLPVPANPGVHAPLSLLAVPSAYHDMAPASNSGMSTSESLNFLQAFEPQPGPSAAATNAATVPQFIDPGLHSGSAPLPGFESASSTIDPSLSRIDPLIAYRIFRPAASSEPEVRLQHNVGLPLPSHAAPVVQPAPAPPAPPAIVADDDWQRLVETDKMMRVLFIDLVVDWVFLTRPASFYPQAAIPQDNYNIAAIQRAVVLPNPLPFLPNSMAKEIPADALKKKRGPGNSVMDDVVNAILQTTQAGPSLPANDGIIFHAPTSQNIQTYLSLVRPEKYPADTPMARGWRSTVNQCLTHGQGWNFLCLGPLPGEKHKRVMLFQRSFILEIVLGSGQCVALSRAGGRL